jgi:uncharacterized SAM-binding protein YcdF (DUF218 family)
MQPKRHRQQRSTRQTSIQRRFHQFLIAGGIGLSLALGSWLLMTTIALRSAASGPVDAFLVLGGSIRREIYMADLAKQYPQTPILISTGSTDPCILLIFQRVNAPIRQVWLEKCAESTFDNYYYAVPILEQWRSRKVKVVTSGTHLPRAKWLAQILLGSHGIWAEMEIVPETGVPGNQEAWFKTGLDVARSLVWAMVSQVYSPRCDRIQPLSEVDIEAWRQEGFKCEYQGQIQ